MKNCLIFACALLLLPAALFGDTDVYWNEFNQAKRDGLPRTAIECLDKIMAETKQQKRYGEWLKALTEKVALEGTIEGNRPEEKVLRMKAQIAATDSTTRPLAQAVLAQWYWHYYQRNNWRFMKRTQTKDMNDSDFTTWDLRKIYNEIDGLYSDLLKGKSILVKIPVSSFKIFLERGNTPEDYRPTLYDFLAQEALIFYSSAEQMVAKPEDAYEIDASTDALGSAEQFIAYRPATTDTGSPKYKVICLFQSLMDYHTRARNTLALIDVDLQRLGYIKNNSFGPQKNRTYIQRMGDIAYRYKKYSQSSRALFYAAKVYGEEGDLNQAYDLAKKGYKRFPDSPGGQMCKAYITELTQKSLSLLAESSLPQGQGALRVSYKNFTKIYFRIYRSKWDVFLKERNRRPFDMSYEELMSLLDEKSLVEWSADLAPTNDFKERSVEVSLPQLDPGFYRVFASWQPDFKGSSMGQHAWFWVSNLTMMVREIGGSVNGLVMDAVSGQPISGVSVSAIYCDYQKGHFEPKILTDKSGFEYKKLADNITDKRGMVDFGSPPLHIQLLATTERETLLNSGENRIYEPNKETTYEQTVIFTDRSMYRPGQPIYYKGIYVRVNRAEDNYRVVPNGKVIIEFLDHNDKPIASDTVESNDFGSFSGSFVAPSDRLMGSMQLRTSPCIGSAGFRVEEYKRPKFQVEFAKPKGSFRLNDLVQVRGTAMNYNGSPVDLAKVQYHVKRTVRYPEWRRWFYWRNSGSREQEISHGTVRTDAKGEFVIAFPAIPDPGVSPDGDPSFNYAVTASVTASDGETRTANASVTVGYKAMEAKMAVDGNLQTQRSFPLTLLTYTLSGAPLPASGSVRIIRLRQPATPVAAKLWGGTESRSKTNAVDATSFGPNWETWPADSTVNTCEFTTQKGNPDTIILTLPTGFYRAECQTSDSFGKEVKAMLPLMILPDTSEKIFSLKLPSLARVNNQTVEVGKTLEVRWGTGYARGQCLVEVLHKNKVVQRYWTDSTVTQHSFSIPVEEKYRGGFLVHLTYVRENRAYQHDFRIAVPWDNKQLSLTLESFRSTLEPGEKQTISLKVKNDKYPLKTAELLAAMYDQSLDQFYRQNWPSLYFFRTDNSGVRSSFINAAQGFSVYSKLNWNESYYYPTITYTRFPSSVLNNLFYYQFNTRPTQAISSNDTVNRSTTAGKITGVVMDAETREPLPGAVVIILGTKMATNTDLDGRYSIINVPVGNNSIQAKMMGYESQTFTGIKSVIGKTTTLNFKLRSKITEVQGTVVKGNSGVPQVRADITSTTKTVSTKEIENMAGVRSYADVVANQSGVEESGIHIRGGRSNEVASFVDGLSTNEDDLNNVYVRKDLNETAFFLPHLLMKPDGTVQFEVTMPEALTKWRFMGFAHGKQLQNGFVSGAAITQKSLMVQPNPPRFLREGDTLLFSAKVINLSDSAMTGLVRLKFRDLATDQSRDTVLGLLQPTQNFTLAAKSSQGFTWRISVPKGLGPLVFTLAAKTQGFSDGEEGTLPVLTSRIFLTESVPLWISRAGSKSFNFDRLKQIGKSQTFDPYRLTVQMTSNPSWYAIQALPYLMEYPHECSEQVFNRYYANSLAGHIANSSPQIRRIFDSWRGTDALKSNLEKNTQLKSLLLEETPWVIQAGNETEAKNRVGRLFETGRLKHELENSYRKLKAMQLENGAWPWFPGGEPNPFITLYITTGFARLEHLGLQTDSTLALKSLDYLDFWIKDIYDHLIDRDTNHLSPLICFYLYGRSFYLSGHPIKAECKTAVDYFVGQADKYWLEVNSRMSQGHLALAMNRWGKKDLANKIMASIKERSVTNEEMGRFWREDELSWWWHRAPIESQAMMIEAFDEVTGDTLAVEECKIWLLKQKQTQDWKTTKATADAIYALILRGTDYLSATKPVEVKLGGMVVPVEKLEQGTGFYEKVYSGGKIKPDYSLITVTKQDKGIAWGGVHFQYFEDMSQVTSHKTNLSLEKSLFVNRDTKAGRVIEPVSGPLAVGDLVTMRIVLRVDRDMEYVHLKDLRPSGFEPVNVLSQYKYQDGLRYYESTKDAASHFFIDYLPKGTYVFEYQLRVQLKGRYQSGIAEIQCMYAPEFNSHSGSIWVEVQ